MKKENVIKKQRKERFEAIQKALKVDDKKFEELKAVFAARREAMKSATTDDQKKQIQAKWKEGIKALVGGKGLDTIREINQARKKKK